MGNVGKVIISAVVAVVIIVVAIVFFGGQNQNIATTNGSNPSNAALNATSPTETTTTQPSTTPATNGTLKLPTASKPSGNSVAPAAATPPTIHLITPVANDVWTIGTQNLISWDKAPNISGSISLTNAVTGQFVGVILPQIGPNQTSYSWNTRDIQLDRTNPLKKNVVPGTYTITISFDGNNLKPITSPSFTITN